MRQTQCKKLRRREANLSYVLISDRPTGITSISKKYHWNLLVNKSSNFKLNLGLINREKGSILTISLLWDDEST